MNDVPHQWIMDRFTALVLMGELDKQEAERLYALFVQRFPDEVGEMKAELDCLRDLAKKNFYGLDLDEQWDNYITESAKEHDPECWKNIAYRDLGVGGPLASCTCGADDE